MRFIVRQISRTADGREIVRPTMFESDQLTIGRAPECDIHLPDLAAALTHAIIRRDGPLRIIVEAAEGLPFDVDGRQAKRAVIDAMRGANIRIGAHVIAVSYSVTGLAHPPTPSLEREGEWIILTIERVGAVSDISEDKDSGRAFSLASALPGKRILAWGLIAAVLLIFLAWPISSYFASKRIVEQGTAFRGDSLWSSGPLSRAHAQLEKNCQACHVDAFAVVSDTACVACHKDVHDHADPVRLATAKGAPLGRCATCHIEHQGKAPMSPTAQQFCSNCHAGLQEKLRDTSLADVSDFGDSHPEFRPTIDVGGTLSRVSLAAHPIEDNALTFSHRLHLSKINGVARMARTLAADNGFGANLVCKDCHVADASGVSFKPIDMEQDCQMCHSLAFDRSGGILRTLRHGAPAQAMAELKDFYAVNRLVVPVGSGALDRRQPGDFAAQKTAFDFRSARPGGGARASRALFAKGGVCTECHQVIPPSMPGGLDFGVVPVRLPVHYLPLSRFDHAAHKAEPCTTCHAAPQSESASDVLLPGIATCHQCHGGEEGRKAVPSSCAMCHDYHAVPSITAERRAIGDERTRSHISKEGG